MEMTDVVLVTALNTPTFSLQKWGSFDSHWLPFVVRAFHREGPSPTYTHWHLIIDQSIILYIISDPRQGKVTNFIQSLCTCRHTLCQGSILVMAQDHQTALLGHQNILKQEFSHSVTIFLAVILIVAICIAWLLDCFPRISLVIYVVD